MRTIVPSLVWFSVLAGGTPFVAKEAVAANVPTDSCAALPATDAGGATGTVVYLNREYGFSFSLPQSWKGFRVLGCRWSGQKSESRDREEGPLLRIRHPFYTGENPRKDIPIMIFTHTQWRAVNDSDLDSALMVSAAPFPPGEIGRNRKYVFALPPRFSYDEPEGVQEVLDIVGGTPLHPARIGSHPQAATHSK